MCERVASVCSPCFYVPLDFPWYSMCVCGAYEATCFVYVFLPCVYVYRLCFPAMRLMCFVDVLLLCVYLFLLQVRPTLCFGVLM